MQKPENGDEASMIASILAGKTQLYHELIRPHERSVYMMAFSFLKNEADSQDVAQEAFLKAFRNLSQFRAESKFSTWLISITLNEARGKLRRQAALPMDSLDESSEEHDLVTAAPLRDWREIPSEVLERKEVRKLIQAAVGILPETYRRVFLLRDVEELSINETAAALEISTALVKARLHRARAMLQKQLAPQLKKVYSGAKRRWFPWL
jgi:RNA polymerase sigma-70 factor (ECF subfamily)